MAASWRVAVRLALVAACCAALPAWGEETVIVRLIAASTTDPAIDDLNGVHHVAIGPAGQRTGRLLLVLPGTTASPQQYATLIERAATLGYHAIGLAYVNEVPVNTLCAGMGASGCHEQVRREILFGTDESNLVEVDAENGVFHRLERLLAYLETLAPDEDWSRYRNASGAVRWNRVVVSGHSQGAGHAAFIARLYRVARAVLFSGTEPAPWTQAGDFATPGADFFGLAHFLEPIYAPIQASWDNIGIPGDPTSVDGATVPYDGSHQLGTAREDCSGDPESNGFYHNCHCVDGWMPPPFPDGTPAFQSVWDHLFALEPAIVPSIGPSGSAALAALLVALATRQMRCAGSGRRKGRRRRGVRRRTARGAARHSA